MSDQLQLLPEKAPEVSAEEIARAFEILQGRDWMTAEEIALAMFHPTLAQSIAKSGGLRYSASESDKRKVRAIANASDGRILSYPGSKGYKLTREATVEEIQNATAKLRHQAGEMHQRALEIDRVYHAKKR
jgi:hypothetical protein